MRTRLLSWFSCGAASAVASKIAVDDYSDEFDVELVYCNLLADEHPDNRRFIADVERWTGRPVKILAHPKYKTTEEVFRGVRYIVGPKGAPCTKMLKKEVRKAYQRPDDTHVLGFTSDEETRINDFDNDFPDLDTEWILRDRRITKQDCYRILTGAGIKLPAMYLLGYRNNNCVGCVKGGMGYWNKIRRDFPEKFASMSAIEDEIGATILRDEKRVDGERVSFPLPLSQLSPGRGRHRDLDFDCNSFTCKGSPSNGRGRR